MVRYLPPFFYLEFCLYIFLSSSAASSWLCFDPKLFIIQSTASNTFSTIWSSRSPFFFQLKICIFFYICCPPTHIPGFSPWHSSLSSLPNIPLGFRALIVPFLLCLHISLYIDISLRHSSFHPVFFIPLDLSLWHPSLNSRALWIFFSHSGPWFYSFTFIWYSISSIVFSSIPQSVRFYFQFKISFDRSSFYFFINYHSSFI